MVTQEQHTFVKWHVGCTCAWQSYLRFLALPRVTVNRQGKNRKNKSDEYLQYYSGNTVVERRVFLCIGFYFSCSICIYLHTSQSHCQIDQPNLVPYKPKTC